MAEKQQSPAFVKKRNRAERAFRREIGKYLEPAVWSDWERVGSLF